MMTPSDVAAVKDWFGKVPQCELRIHDDPFGRPGSDAYRLTHIVDRPMWTVLEFEERFVLLFAGLVRVQSISDDELVLSGFSQLAVATQGYGNDRPALKAYFYGSVFFTRHGGPTAEALEAWLSEHGHRPSGYGEVER